MAHLVVLDRQHQGKPSNPADRGAVFPDGTTEAAHAWAYIAAAVPWLRAAGLQVVVLTGGEYGDRNREANRLGAAAYVACHVNAGLTEQQADADLEYALTEYSADSGDTWGSLHLAQTLLHHVDDELSQRASGPKALRRGQRGHVCVAACRMPAAIFEPYFTVDPRNDAVVGRQLARGLCAFLGVPPQPPQPTPPPEETDDVITVTCPRPPDDKGRYPFWKVTAAGAVYAVNGAPGAKNLSEYGVDRSDVIGAGYDPERNKLVLRCDDIYQEPDGSWNSSTYGLELFG